MGDFLCRLYILIFSEIIFSKKIIFHDLLYKFFNYLYRGNKVDLQKLIIGLAAKEQTTNAIFDEDMKISCFNESSCCYINISDCVLFTCFNLCPTNNSKVQRKAYPFQGKGKD